MGKGALTRATILDAGLEVAATQGLEALAIGPLAETVGLSKSGLFAHFRSKEGLQLAVLEHARGDFVTHVLVPALAAPRGEPRIRAILEHWLEWSAPDERNGGCVFIQAAAEYDDRPGPVRELLVSIQRDWNDDLVLAAAKAKQEGHFRADLDPAQFAYDLYAVILSHQFHTRLMGDPGAPERTRCAFERLLADAKAI
ncbi:MAG: AcrR family transcriptional regulator [Planctomycetota bacterium]|jgi:AcrR family transcriptional regulator